MSDFKGLTPVQGPYDTPVFKGVDTAANLLAKQKAESASQPEGAYQENDMTFTGVEKAGDAAGMDSPADVDQAQRLEEARAVAAEAAQPAATIVVEQPAADASAQPHPMDAFVTAVEQPTGPEVLSQPPSTDSPEQL